MVGDEPMLMLAPDASEPQSAQKSGNDIQDIDRLRSMRRLPQSGVHGGVGVDHSKVNVDGGAIALGHPPGATGAVLMGPAWTPLNETGSV